MGVFRTAREDRATTLTVRIVEEVAEREGVDPLDLTPPLHDVIDPEAVASLVSGRSGGGTRDDVRVTFTYLGYDITVTGDDVRVSDG